MQIPVPRNKLVAFTLAGALVTALVAAALAVPPGDLANPGEQTDPSGSTASGASQQIAVDAPTPNQNFTPAIQTPPNFEEEEHEAEYEEHEEDEDEADEHEEGE